MENKQSADCMNECDVTVVIVSFNTCNLTLECLRSVFEQTKGVSFEVIVVDNASGDGTSGSIREEFPAVFLIENDQNRGFAAANNQGMKLARGRYILLLNPDTLILDGAIEKMVRYVDGHPDVGCAGCQVLEDGEKIQMTCFRFPSPLNIFLSVACLDRLFRKYHFFGRYWMTDWDRRNEREVDVVSGMFMLVRRETVSQVGLMDEEYFIYAEEADWCWRFWKNGWRCVFTPIARIIHRDGGGKSTKQVRPRMYVQIQKSILIFLRKNEGCFAWMATKCIFIFFMLLRMIFLSVLGLITGSKQVMDKARLAMFAVRFHFYGFEPEL